ncbi:MAG: bile acid:sodium symporter family protein [Pseudomonadota bacterium]
MHQSIADINLLGLEFLGMSMSDIAMYSLIVIMATMGLTLTPADFEKVYQAPKAVALGLTGQLIVLPAFAFLIVIILSPPPAVAIGLIILACCPGGATSNFFSFLARGDVALSIALTAISGFIVVFSIPIFVNVAISMFGENDPSVRLPVVQSTVQIFMLVVAPVLAGMSVRRYFPKLALSIERYATKVSFAAVLFTMAVMLYAIWPILPSMLGEAGAPVLLLNATMMALGFGAARLLQTGERQSRSICIEIGVQNYVLSLVIAIALLKNPEFAVAPAVYLFTMYLSVFSFIAYCRFVRDKTPIGTGQNGQATKIEQI